MRAQSPKVKYNLGAKVFESFATTTAQQLNPTSIAADNATADSADTGNAELAIHNPHYIALRADHVFDSAPPDGGEEIASELEPSEFDDIADFDRGR